MSIRQPQFIEHAQLDSVTVVFVVCAGKMQSSIASIEALVRLGLSISLFTRQASAGDADRQSQSGTVKRNITSKRDERPSGGADDDPKRVESRLRQVDKGKSTAGYDRYRLLRRKEDRLYGEPQTPDAHQALPKRQWDANLSQWRRDVHKYDLHRDPKADLADVKRQAVERRLAAGRGNANNTEDASDNKEDEDPQLQKLADGRVVARDWPATSWDLLGWIYRSRGMRFVDAFGGDPGIDVRMPTSGSSVVGLPHVLFQIRNPPGAGAESSASGATDDGPSSSSAAAADVAAASAAANLAIMLQSDCYDGEDDDASDDLIDSDGDSYDEPRVRRGPSAAEPDDWASGAFSTYSDSAARSDEGPAFKKRRVHDEAPHSGSGVAPARSGPTTSSTTPGYRALPLRAPVIGTPLHLSAFPISGMSNEPGSSESGSAASESRAVTDGLVAELQQRALLLRAQAERRPMGTSQAGRPSYVPYCLPCEAAHEYRDDHWAAYHAAAQGEAAAGSSGSATLQGRAPQPRSSSEQQLVWAQAAVEAQRTAKAARESACAAAKDARKTGERLDALAARLPPHLTDMVHDELLR